MERRRNWMIRLISATLIFGCFLFTNPSVTVGTSDITITANPSNWTNQNVTLTATGKDIDKIMLPDGTVLNQITATYIARENGAYSFIGLNSEGEAVAFGTFVVNYIDRVGKSGSVTPNDGIWRNTDVQVKINTE
ncbi:hypothetical protein Cdeb_01277 [Caldibacillus debilis GB1]|uniref:Uncharacterized protein n=1 Tax=Caldibacillus debilis GB1 TaxID=1339248 RepID=A0A420VDP2_9BACI|nr:hypothetical protein Cdeb_01277 [Caldibacillus debilis GB1]